MPTAVLKMHIDGHINLIHHLAYLFIFRSFPNWPLVDIPPCAWRLIVFGDCWRNVNTKKKWLIHNQSRSETICEYYLIGFVRV